MNINIGKENLDYESDIGLLFHLSYISISYACVINGKIYVFLNCYDIGESRKKNPQKLTLLSSRSHPRFSFRLKMIS